MISSARIAPLPANDDRRDTRFQDLAARIGYGPAAILTMARKAGFLDPILSLANIAVLSTEELNPELRALVACEAARVSGSYYTAIHLAHSANHQHSVGWDKLSDLPRYRESSLFSEEEKAALSIASAGGTLPVGDVGKAFQEARRFFADDELVEIVATITTISLFSHWNGMMATEREDIPAEAVEHVAWLARFKPGT